MQEVDVSAGVEHGLHGDVALLLGGPAACSPWGRGRVSTASIVIARGKRAASQLATDSSVERSSPVPCSGL